MPSLLKAGARFRSVVCDTQVMVVKAPANELDLRCGGAPMTGAAASSVAAGSLAPALSGGTLIGKRYVNSSETLELLCTKGGAGTLSLGETPIEVKLAKQLPSSD